MIILIDKPTGITSFDVIRILRKQLGIRKIGHAGTLDPFATGLLIIATEGDTKKLTEITGQKKEYVARFEFGKISTTDDIDGAMSDYGGSPQPKPPREDFEKAIASFMGEIEQRPPNFSAVKVNGVRAYTLARRDGFKSFDKLGPRCVTFYSIDILAFNWPFVDLRIVCSKGAYIRSLARDLGEKLGCGAYVHSLRRTAIGEYKLADAQQLPDQSVANARLHFLRRRGVVQ